MILDKDNPDFEYNDNFFQYLLDNNIEFDEEDIKEFINCYCYLTKKAGTWDNCWIEHITTICKLNEHYYAVEWDAGLTEYVENHYDKQPYEVFPEEERRIFIINKWKNKDGNIICEFYKDGKE